MLDFFRLILILIDFFFNLVLMLAKRADSFLMQFLFLRIRVSNSGVSKEIQIFNLHIDAYLRCFMEVSQG
jgi:hypothetical protein